MNKLHIACGTVYLKGYINIDLPLTNHYKAKDRPDLVAKNITTIDKYYKKKVTVNQFMKGKFHKADVVCDLFADVKRLPFHTNEVDEIVGMHIFEHFSYKEGELLLSYWYRLLKEGGSLRLHVPDVRGIIEEYNIENEEWTLRQLYGSQKNEYGIHKAGYTIVTLTKLLYECGYRNIEVLPNINDYAAFGIKGYK